MMSDIEKFFLFVAGGAGLYFVSTLIWSIIYPERRIWPPKKATIGIKIRVWVATVTIFTAAFVLGIVHLNTLKWPLTVRWGIGLPLVVFGNFIVWSCVMKIGIGATSDEKDRLKTDGLYAWSRNPQYVADILILIGWAMLSASGWVIFIATVGVLILGIAPLAEEPWLEETYGQKYRDYKKRVRRYF